MSTNRPSAKRASRPRVRPLPRGNTLYTPDASTLRRAAERRSAKPLIFLHQLPAWIAPIVMVALLITGAAVRGPIGAVALCGVALVLGWLASVSWPRLTSGGRAGRLIAIVVALALAGFVATR